MVNAKWIIPVFDEYPEERDNINCFLWVDKTRVHYVDTCGDIACLEGSMFTVEDYGSLVNAAAKLLRWCADNGYIKD
jgi:hypothetical protein